MLFVISSQLHYPRKYLEIFSCKPRLKSRETFIKSFKITFFPLLSKFEAGTCENGWKLKSWSYWDTVGECGWATGDVAKFYYGYYRSNRSALGEPRDGCEGYNSHHSEYDKMWCDERIYDIWYLWYQNFICLNKVLKAFKTLSGRLVAWVDVLLWKRKYKRYSQYVWNVFVLCGSVLWTWRSIVKSTKYYSWVQ